MTAAGMAAEPRRVEAGARGRFGWVMFDWANQPFLALGAFVFAPYFATTVAGDAAGGQALWGVMLGAVGILVAVASPVLGAVADVVGRRKPSILAFSALTAVASAALWFAEPGAVVLALVLYGLALAGAEFAAVFNNAMLPSIVDDRHLGRLSGIGWGMGYAGGLVALIAVLLAIVLPAEPMFGLDPEAHEPERIAGPIAAAWLVLFLLPFFLWTPDLPRSGIALGPAVGEGLRRLGETGRHARRLGNVVRFLLARMLYHDGLTALMSFGGIYGAGVFGWETTSLGLFAILLTVAAVPGTFAGGFLADRLGAKRTVVLAIVGLLVGAVGVLSVGPDRILFMMEVAPPEEGAGPFAGAAEQAFLAFGLLIGFCVGPAQAASRTLMARLSPPGMTTEFFGLYAFSGKATAFAAPLLIGLVTALSGDQRTGLLVVLVFLLGGLALFVSVREERAAPVVAPR